VPKQVAQLRVLKLIIKMKKKSENGKVEKKKGLRRCSLNKDKIQKGPKHSTLSHRKSDENEAKEAPK